MGPGMPGGILTQQGTGWVFPSLALPQAAHVHVVPRRYLPRPGGGFLFSQHLCPLVPEEGSPG